MGGIITWGVGQEGMLTNCAKFPPLVTHVLMSKKTRYFLSLKIEKNSQSSSWSLIKGATGVCHEDIAISVQFCAEFITQ